MARPVHDGLNDITSGTIFCSLTPEESGEATEKRTQKRTVKSVRFGEITIGYGVGKSSDGRIVTPGELRLIVPPGKNFAYDTILFVTVLRYVNLMQREEIQAEILRDHYFKISTGSISELSLEGLAYLERCHFAHVKKLAELYGEYFFIHLDGTNEGGMFNHFVVREGMSGNVLLARKISSENKDDIIDILKEVREKFGCPVAVISDLSPAIGKAVKSVFKTIPHRLCIFHFLRDIGKDMLSSSHQEMKTHVQKLKKQLKEIRDKFIKAADKAVKSKRSEQETAGEYCQWMVAAIDRINDCKKDLSGEGMPFDLAYTAFFERCLETYSKSADILVRAEKHPEPFWSLALSMENAVRKFLEESMIPAVRTERINAVFLQLRDILHPKAEKTKVPMNWGVVSDKVQLEDLAEQLTGFLKKAGKKMKAAALPEYEREAWTIVHTHLKKYGDKLNPVIQVNGKKIILPRTNNRSEIGFRDKKRKARRTTGKKNLSRYMDDLPAQAFYIENLQDPEYVKAVYGEKEILDHFHEIGRDDIRKDVKNIKRQRRSPKSIDYKLIRNDDFFKLMEEKFSGQRALKRTG